MSDHPPAPRDYSPAEFAEALLRGVRADGLQWQTLEDLFRLAMQQGARSGRVCEAPSSDPFKGRWGAGELRAG